MCISIPTLADTEKIVQDRFSWHTDSRYIFYTAIHYILQILV